MDMVKGVSRLYKSTAAPCCSQIWRSDLASQRWFSWHRLVGLKEAQICSSTTTAKSSWHNLCLSRLTLSFAAEEQARQGVPYKGHIGGKRRRTQRAQSRLVPATPVKAMTPCASPAHRGSWDCEGQLLLLICRSVGYNWALREPIEGGYSSDSGSFTILDGKPSCAR